MDGVQGYKEGELTFLPTFKFDPGTDVYDSSAKSRIPSWCDRVLWRCNTDAFDAVELLQYTHVPQLKVSDHRYAHVSWIWAQLSLDLLSWQQTA